MCPSQTTDDRRQTTDGVCTHYYKHLNILILEGVYKLGVVFGGAFAGKYEEMYK